MKKILIIAGPNGAGKTTFAEEFLPHEGGCPEFVNHNLGIVDEWAIYDDHNLTVPPSSFDSHPHCALTFPKIGKAI
jgi:hypothetical protein